MTLYEKTLDRITKQEQERLVAEAELRRKRHNALEERAMPIYEAFGGIAMECGAFNDDPLGYRIAVATKYGNCYIELFSNRETPLVRFHDGNYRWADNLEQVLEWIATAQLTHAPFYKLFAGG